MAKQKESLVEWCRGILGVSIGTMMSILEVKHNQSWKYLVQGGRLRQLQVERLLIVLPEKDLLAIRAALIEDYKRQIEAAELPIDHQTRS